MPDPLKPELVRRDPRTLKLLDVNARFMRKEQFDALVRNVRNDGVLTSVPLIWADPDSGQEIVLSGNHRVEAAIAAELEAIDCYLLTQPLDEQRRLAIQLSHNAIAGEDDPAVLRQLYEQLDQVDWRDYSGLDDKTLDLLDQVDVAGLSEANLDFATVTLVFLPHEIERAEKALADAKGLVQADQRWIATDEQYEPTLDALQTAHAAWKVGNVAAALQVILDVFEAHLTDTQEGFLDPDTGEASRNGIAPIEAVLGSRTMPTDAAAVVNKAISRMIETGDVDPGARWKALELLAADWLASE